MPAKKRSVVPSPLDTALSFDRAFNDRIQAARLIIAASAKACAELLDGHGEVSLRQCNRGCLCCPHFQYQLAQPLPADLALSIALRTLLGRKRAPIFTSHLKAIKQAEETLQKHREAFDSIKPYLSAADRWFPFGTHNLTLINWSKCSPLPSYTLATVKLNADIESHALY